MLRRGVYPGSFNPPTIAHLAIAEAVCDQRGLDVVHFTMSRVPLGKQHVAVPPFDQRVQVVVDSLIDHPRLDAHVTDDQLIADIADGYDVVIMGADKWHQVCDPAFYGDSPTARDAAVDRLPELALIARPPHETPDGTLIVIGADVAEVSSSGARAGRDEWMTPAARRFAERAGGWPNSTQ